MNSFSYKCKSQPCVLTLSNTEARWAPQGLTSQRLAMLDWTEAGHRSRDTTSQNPLLHRPGYATFSVFLRYTLVPAKGKLCKDCRERCCCNYLKHTHTHTHDGITHLPTQRSKDAWSCLLPTGLLSWTGGDMKHWGLLSTCLWDAGWQTSQIL